MELKGKSAMIYQAGGAIGRAVALAFAKVRRDVIGVMGRVHRLSK